jgi:hypothetical protein
MCNNSELITIWEINYLLIKNETQSMIKMYWHSYIMMIMLLYKDNKYESDWVSWFKSHILTMSYLFLLSNSVSLLMTVFHTMKTEKSNEIDFMNQFILSWLCNLLKASLTIFWVNLLVSILSLRVFDISILCSETCK